MSWCQGLKLGEGHIFVLLRGRLNHYPKDPGLSEIIWKPLCRLATMTDNQLLFQNGAVEHTLFRGEPECLIQGTY